MPHKTKSNLLHVLLIVCALMYFGLSRLADHNFARFADLPCYIGENGLGAAMNQVKNLLWLIAVRAVVRVALGMNAVSEPFGTDGAGFEPFFDQLSLYNALEGIPGWARCAIFALNLCLWGLIGYRRGRADRNIRAERLD